jgi:DNA-binding transcriptional MerR regulator
MAKRDDRAALLTIGQLARACGASVDTIRYSGRERLLPRPQRSPSL